MVVVTVERPYAGQLAHERKQARRATLVEAGLELLGTHGVNATTVRAVLQKTGLSQRYFYESFANIDELLIGVFDHVMKSTTARVIAELPQTGGDIRAMI